MRDTKSELIALRVTPALKEKITKAANKESRTVSNYLLKLILEATKEQ